MNRRERLMASIAGKSVDRPPVSFYEINGEEDIYDENPFNIYSDSSWKPLIELARDKTDRIIMKNPPINELLSEPENVVHKSNIDENGSKICETTIQTRSRSLKKVTRRDTDVNTVWVLEHLLKNAEDLKSWLDWYNPVKIKSADVSDLEEAENKIGDSGVLMANISDPICELASMFDMEEFLILAMTEKDLFHKALEKILEATLPCIEEVAKKFPGRMWRIYGPEYASEPFLPPALFREYVTTYDKLIVDAIHKHGGYARIHSHGNLKNILDHIVETGCVGLDPIEPQPQGDVDLAYVRKHYGKEMTLFGNLEASDLENLPTDQFAEKIKIALGEGVEGDGRGFVLMPSACPYGRKLSSLSMKNYEKMVELVEAL